MSSNDLQAGLETSVENGRLKLTLSGRLDAASVSMLWPKTADALRTDTLREITVEGHGISYCDGAGTALLVSVRREGLKRGITVEFTGLSENVSAMLALYPPETLSAAVQDQPKHLGHLVEQIGRAFCETLTGLREHIAFIGELTVALFRALLRPGSVRLKDFFMVVEASGPQALPIVGILGFLIGLIIAFQGANLMRQFGAEIYIADSAGLLMTRELGPLITAILVAGRTGSAFAAELGTMKVNEELDALTTMGLDPVRFLVIPRVLAASVMTPLLTVFADLAGITGGAVVMLGMDYPLITYVNRLLNALGPADYLSGLVKALVFGILIASAGCLCGLKTGEGASAVGHSATRAVVSSILLIVLTDGIFAVLFFFLGI
ncbi:ABC transporter permease [Pontiella agarivorans]|uniref:MlaE family lipid ABC transporter permease subunit n=1 Tax=Pontiella agarivorans TaxID=3038953 RepID=A0ABU5MTL9_9BACT|nr:MlaE family lipid ABC transporter permease subunit [Pontiella agarivorans]MDZ8117497.1 MlaE family lipid ABC transporter permease subunit [Pontiella agarivorans]